MQQQHAKDDLVHDMKEARPLMLERDYSVLQCHNFSTTFSAQSLSKCDECVKVCSVRNYSTRHQQKPFAAKVITTHISRSLIPEPDHKDRYQAIVCCNDIQTYHASLRRWKDSAETVTKLLLRRCLKSNSTLIKKGCTRKPQEILIRIVLTVKDGYVSRSFRLGDSRCMERVWSSWARDGVMQFTGLYFAVLGGAYSSLAKANSQYARKAGILAKRQIRLAQLVNDPIQECKCWLYYAEDLIHMRKLRKAEKILENQRTYVSDQQNSVGGVGKSSVTTQLSLALVNQGFKVGVLDVDLTGPSIPRMLGLDGKQVHQASSGWVPVYADESQRLCCMSIGFLLQNKNDSVGMPGDGIGVSQLITNGRTFTAMIKQFLQDVCWGELDYLVIDTPPGTSDEHISVVEYLKAFNPDGAVIVTTPQGVALADVRKELSFCKKVQLPILGVVENMSGFVCPHCAVCILVALVISYPEHAVCGGESMAKDYQIPFLGRVPIDPQFTSMVETEGEGSYVNKFESSNLFPTFQKIAEQLTAQTPQQ
ncbi:hypothetical protein NQZ79_g3620 [Umbelopsis isabellina]|nr:hypothetical protein NQZ79_g3620 [Umbelopsis isabellina]